MIEPRLESWLSKAKQDIPRVLREFWERRIQNDDPDFTQTEKKYYKEYIKSCYADKGLPWTDEVDREFESIIVERHDFDRFKRFFGDWFTISSAMVIDRVHLIQPKEREVKEIKEGELREISEFLRETKTSAAIALGNAKSEFKTVLSPHIPASKPFQIHSVTKMFTGALALKMIEKMIIPEEELKKPLSEAFGGEFLKSLPESFRKRFQEHLSKVSLLQLMSHRAGLGDYYEFENKSMDYKNPRSYQKAIIDAVARNSENPELPEIKEISDLLQFSEDKTYPIGEWHYSNVGITLVGLATEFAYKQYKKNHPEDTINPDFDSLLSEYILKEAKIESKNFTKTKPPDGRYNKDKKADVAAPYMTAGPAGYYWTTVEDLARFGAYFYNEYNTNAEFQRLVNQYGGEFHPEEDVFSHTGTLTASSSAFLSITKKGNIIAVVCDNSDEDANALEARIKRNIFSESPIPAREVKSSTSKDRFFQPTPFESKSSSSLWYDQEQEEAYDDMKKILLSFWTERILKNNVKSVHEFRDFIISELYKNDPGNQKKINELFDKALKREIDFSTFFNEAIKFGIKCIRMMNFAEKLVSFDPIRIQEHVHAIDDSDIQNIQDYMRAKNISGSIALRADDGPIVTPDFKENKSNAAFAMHSVGKVFTGMMVFTMIRKGLLSEKDLHKPIQLDEKVLERLPASVRSHLKKVTLHQCMTHTAGLGDYLDLYFKELEKGKVPEMKKVDDFCTFVDPETFPIGQFKYSNAGILLVGLAMQHAYQKKTGEARDYNDLLREFILNEAKMTSFSTHKPDNAQTNPEDKLAPLIVGSPGGGYWTTAEDLALFGKWIYDQCKKDPGLKPLIEKYGQEFYHPKYQLIQHPGNIASSSASLMVSLKTGAVVATLSDQPNVAIDLSARVQKGVISDASLDITDEEMAQALKVRH